MATLSQQVKDLKRQNKDLLETIDSLNQRINQLQADIQENPLYQQALSDIRMLQLQLDQAQAEIARLKADQQEKKPATDMFRNVNQITEHKSKAGRPQIYSEELRQEIRNRRASGLSLRAIAKEYGIGLGTVHKICEDIAVSK